MLLGIINIFSEQLYWVTKMSPFFLLLVMAGQVTWILASDWSILVRWPQYCSLIGHHPGIKCVSDLCPLQSSDNGHWTQVLPHIQYWAEIKTWIRLIPYKVLNQRNNFQFFTRPVSWEALVWPQSHLVIETLLSKWSLNLENVEC